MKYNRRDVIQRIMMLHITYSVSFSKIEEESGLPQGILRNWIGEAAILSDEQIDTLVHTVERLGKRERDNMERRVLEMKRRIFDYKNMGYEE